MPVRFTSPSLGGQRNGFLKKGEREAAISFRRLYADQWFVGTQVEESSAPFGKPLFLDIRSLDLSLALGLTSRTSLAVTLPASHGTHSRYYADGVRHRVEATGIGDLNAILSHWIMEPGEHSDGNIALAAGIKLPTGRNNREDNYFAADRTVTRRVVDQSIQPGDGSTGIILQSQAYRAIRENVTAYAFGSYLLSPKRQTEIPSPLPGVALSVPDVYSGRAGIAYALPEKTGTSANIGLRIDGIPIRDVLGGSDRGFRRPGYTLYVDPGLAVRTGNSEFTLSVPIRARQNFSRSLIDHERNFRGGGDLADYLVFAGYSVRF